MSTSFIGVPLEGLAEFCRKVAAEGAVLLQNEGEVLPLKQGDRVSVFGRIQLDYYRSGTGSGGSVNVPYTTNLLDGLRSKSGIVINEDLASVYEEWIRQNPFDDGGGGWAAEPWHQKEMPLSTELVSDARKKSDKAIIVIGRTAGEDKDNDIRPGSYLLTADERRMIRLVTDQFEKTIVVLNVSNIIDMSWVEDDLKHPVSSIIYAWQGGMEGGNAIADVLAGDVTPSGKLTDTIAWKIEDYPSTSNYGGEVKNLYEEDIYVGYRYFETFCPDAVQYEFGYGISYTEFKVDPLEAKKFVEDSKEYIMIDVNVTNIGDVYKGKEVVQVYAEAPQGKLGKPARVLAGFAKTKLLAPGESEQLSIRIPVDSLASYDDAGLTGHRSAYVLEPGTYRLYAGTSVKKVEPVLFEGRDGFTLDQLRIVEQLEEVMAPRERLRRIKPGKRREDGTYEIIYEDVPERTVDLAKRIADRLPPTLPWTGDQGYRLQDVAEGKVSLDTFIAQLSDEELATIVRGEGMSSPLVTPGTASAFGGVGYRLQQYGIPVGCTADGPSGIRMDSGHQATQLPIGTLLAATWNVELVEQLYELEGKEMLRNGIDVLLGPGMNIRRSPLNGRNFEYFSEDPLITGEFGAATVRGIARSGTQATLKHLACNNQEHHRTKVDAVVSERALREIYLKGFEIAVKKGGAKSIMTAYNPINGHWTASNYDLNTTVLRKEWGFDGIVMTDWWASMNDCVNGGPESRKYTGYMIRAQNDLYMVVHNFGAEVNSMEDDTLDALAEGRLTRGELQRSAMNICRFLMQLPVFSRTGGNPVEEPIRKIAAKVDPSQDSGSPADGSPADDLHANQPPSPELSIVEEEREIAISPSGIASFKVKSPGIYAASVRIRSDGWNTAQNLCRIMLNGEHMATIQSNGTSGQWIKQRLIPVELEAGSYDLQLEHVKPGIDVDWIGFRKV